MKDIIPTGPQVIREAIVILAGVLIASYVLSRFPKLSSFVASQSITVKDGNNNPLYF